MPRNPGCSSGARVRGNGSDVEIRQRQSGLTGNRRHGSHADFLIDDELPSASPLGNRSWTIANRLVNIGSVYAIEWTPPAVRTLLKLPRNLRNRLVGKIELLAADPRAPNNNVRRLAGDSAYRLRVGDWQVIYELREQRLVIEVVRIAPRGSAYE
jgi:mRNA interferase RelE/StbE